MRDGNAGNLEVGLAKIEEELRARRLAALERVADFLFAGQEAAWLRQVLPEWRDGSARNRKCGLCGRPFICGQDHFSRYPGCEPPVNPRPPLVPVRGPVAAQPL